MISNELSCMSLKLKLNYNELEKKGEKKKSKLRTHIDRRVEIKKENYLLFYKRREAEANEKNFFFSLYV